MEKKLAFDLATKAASHSPAKRRKVGAIIVSDITGQVLCSGWNHNQGKPCEDENGNTLDTVIHAERAAIMGMPIDVDLFSCTMYVTHQPCVDCETMLKAEGLKYEVVEEFLKFDGEKLRYDLVPTSTTRCLCFKLRPYAELCDVFKFFETYRELYSKDKPTAMDNLLEAYSLLAFHVEGKAEVIPTKALAAVASVITYGARKYKPNNWRTCSEPERYEAAFMRHYLAHISGEEVDTESGYPHLWHALTNLTFLVELR